MCFSASPQGIEPCEGFYYKILDDCPALSWYRKYNKANDFYRLFDLEIQYNRSVKSKENL